MAEKLTPQQQAAVENRGGKLLVSAAAGSGKTKVLVDRLIRYLLDPMQPANIDDFLIITYTKAAAAELRGKIAAKLTEHLAEDPQNRHLQRQMQRLYLAKISTVHAFCADILKEYAYMLDIPADFRVADENECRELRAICVDKVLNSAYESAQMDSDFRAFVDTQGLGRDDRLVPEIMLKVYDSSRCHLDPDGWLSECVENAEVSDAEDASQTIWGSYLMQDLFRYLQLQIGAMRMCADMALASNDMEKPAALMMDTVHQLEYLRSSATWDEVVSRSNIDFGRLTFSKKITDLELAERIKAVRSACKKGLEKKLKSFTDPSCVVLSDLEDSAAAIRGIVNLVRSFSQTYDAMKRQRRILDFGDLEQATLDLLRGKKRSGLTSIANEISDRFREIMVDEYQDSNAVQDSIFSALTEKRQNCFMVGDVKQSIYQFRLADPGIFLEKYESFVPAVEAKPNEGRKILLTRNFRSGGGVLAGVNDVFSECMSKEVGGLVYDENEALVEGVEHTDIGEPEVEFWTIGVEESTYDEEAAFVADRIQSLLDGTHFVRQGSELRLIKPEDIAILLRSPGSVGGYYTSALARLGIRSSTGGGEDLLQTAEVCALRSFLQTISNPRQDIPLIACLTSPVFAFTADDLAALRSGKRRCSVYDALLSWDNPKANAFLDMLQRLRRIARLKTLAELIEEIFSLTRMDCIFAAMPDGDVRSGNLLSIYHLAAGFESGGHRDLEQFLQYLTVLEEDGLISAADQTAAGAVTIMSIHKSKGLEFPVVIVAGLSREFNRESVRAQLLCDQKLGLGLSAVDSDKRVRYPTIAKRAIAVKTVADSLSEEMRVLYVALTRARDRLIMTYAVKKPEADISDMACRMDIGDPQLLSMDAVCPGDWVLMAALRRTEAGELFKVGAKPQRVSPGVPAWKIAVTSAPEIQAVGTFRENDDLTLPASVLEQIRAGLSYQYPYSAATKAPSKQTATQRKGRYKDAEAAEFTEPQKTVKRSWRTPSLIQKIKAGTDVGTAFHAALQHIRYDACSNADSISQELLRLESQQLITKEQRELVDADKLARFFATDMGKRLRESSNVLREFKFSILDNGANFDSTLTDEQILLQGVVDCAIIEDDGITVLDFKTDYVTDQTIDQRTEYYRPQVAAYADALTRIYGLPVMESLLYYFSMEEFRKL